MMKDIVTSCHYNDFDRNVRKHWFPKVSRHILTIVLVEALVIMWRRLLELNLQCFAYFSLKFSLFRF